MILIDTSVLSMVFRRTAAGPKETSVRQVFETLMKGDDVLGLPAIVLQEILSGLPSERQFREMRSKLEGAFLVLPATVEDHIEGAKLRNLCVSKGTNVSGIDCLIAAMAIGGDHQLFTLDGDLDAIRKHSPLKLLEH